MRRKLFVSLLLSSLCAALSGNASESGGDFFYENMSSLVRSYVCLHGSIFGAEDLLCIAPSLTLPSVSPLLIERDIVEAGGQSWGQYYGDEVAQGGKYQKRRCTECRGLDGIAFGSGKQCIDSVVQLRSAQQRN